MSALTTLKKLSDERVKPPDTLQRILLINDGTLTEVLEATFLEPIRLVKVAEDIDTPSAPQEMLHAPFADENILKRKILLQGAQSKRNYAYAHSLIAVDRLSPNMRDELIHTNTPIGRLWIKYKLETFKEIQEIKYLKANDLCHHFNCLADDDVLARTTFVYSMGKVLFSIKEYFPTSYGETLGIGQR